MPPNDARHEIKGQIFVIAGCILDPRMPDELREDIRAALVKISLALTQIVETKTDAPK